MRALALALALVAGPAYADPPPLPASRARVVTGPHGSQTIADRPLSWSEGDRTHYGKKVRVLAGLSSGVYELNVDLRGQSSVGVAVILRTASVNARAFGRRIMLRYADGVELAEGVRSLQLQPYRAEDDAPAVPGVYLVLSDRTVD